MEAIPVSVAGTLALLAMAYSITTLYGGILS
jgi:hypothetical protein